MEDLLIDDKQTYHDSVRQSDVDSQNQTPKLTIQMTMNELKEYEDD